ncbi:MAG: crotonase/enoyl-CoA hydratase family protein [Candidatus Lambdaproteobacteria bacterium]|nr:crotonase/enoyl-CoA hydratase family protein [Candidatus Lambdaproteobacteria bacterium]
MSYEMIDLQTSGAIATITLNRPDKFNTIRTEMWFEIEDAISQVNQDPDLRVIVLQGAGDSFCAGFDFSGNLDHYKRAGVSLSAEDYDPGMDMIFATSPFLGPVPKFMAIWRSARPVIAKVQGWCVGGGSEMALCADLVIASEDARFGTPYARVWGCHLTGMWIYRLGLTRAKQFALTGDSISGREAADIGLINEACPLEALDERTQYWAQRMAQIPLTQLAAMKLIVNQAYENMGLQTTQYMGTIMDGLMRNTPEGRAFVRSAAEKGVGGAVAERDAPFGDYSQGGKDMKPRRRGKR